MNTTGSICSFGYDLGDGESFVDIVKSDERGNINPLSAPRLPSAPNSAESIPTGFGYDVETHDVVLANDVDKQIGRRIENYQAYFKRRPSDLLRTIDKKRHEELEVLFENGDWPDNSVCPEVHTPEFETFKNDVIAFTNAIFEDEEYSHLCKTIVSSYEQIIFCVGHPTKWDKLDRNIYRAILKSSVLGQNSIYGKPARLIVDKESRAAYLHLKDYATRHNKHDIGILSKGEYSILIDVGSSTVDITALDKSSNNYVYNSGNNYLGVRCIDFMIYDWYLNQLSKSDKMLYNSLSENNSSYDIQSVIRCRKIKESLYSSKDDYVQELNLRGLPPKYISKNDIRKLASEVPVGPVLKEHLQICNGDISKMAYASWITLFKSYLSSEKKTMIEEKGLKIGKIIMTGSATRMDFVREVINDVFNDITEKPLWDADPSRSVSKGLALVGPSDEKSKMFQRDIEELQDNVVQVIIKNDIPKLANKVSSAVAEIIKKQVMDYVHRWRKGDYPTLNSMKSAMETSCSGNNLKTLLQNNNSYKKAIENWSKNILGRDIALELQDICNKYGVTDFSLESLNIMNTIDVASGNGKFSIIPNAVGDFVETIIVIVGSIITLIIVPSIVSILITLADFIVGIIAGLIFDIGIASSGIGWFIAPVVGVAAAVYGIGWLLDSSAVSDLKHIFTERVMDYNIPLMARKLISDEMIQKKLNETDIEGNIIATLQENKNKKKIVDSVKNSIKDQIGERALEIRYCIESR